MMARRSSAAVAMLQLAIAAGPTVATWDCCSTELDSNFQPHGVESDVADVVWNHNGQVLASIATNMKKENQLPCDPVVLTSLLSQLPLESFRNAWSGKLLMGCYTTISFGVKSRYLCLGESSGDVSLFDLKKCLAVRQYSSPDGLPCRQACLDPTESFVLALSRETLSVFRLREGTMLHKFSACDDASGSFSFTTFHLSPFRQTPLVVAVGTDQGYIQVLDNSTSSDATIERWEPRFTLSVPDKRQKSPIVGLAFSAQVKPLLVSASRHGHLSFDDVDLGHRIEHRQVAERVVTSLAYHNDGNILALGTDDGHLAVYDIRNLNVPIATYQMSDAITCLKFAPAGAVVVSSSQRLAENDTPVRSNVSPPKTMPPLLATQTTAAPTALAEHKDHAELRSNATGPGGTIDMENLKAFIQQEVRATLSNGDSNQFTNSTHRSSPCLSPMDLAAVKAVIQEELGIIRDELRQHIQNLHIDMLQAFLRIEERFGETDGDVG